MDGDLQWMPAWQLIERMARRAVSPVEVMEALLARVERLSPQLNPFITVVADQALAQARRAEQAILGGEPLGPLHGIPISIKDVFWTEGIRTTYGSKLFEDFVPPQDAVFVARLRAAGAIVFAKSNTPEFSSNPRTVNLLTRECLTPWDPALERSSGGSSGGSGASVAAGVGPVSIGSDDGGSIRLPSAFNGLFGFVPSRGRVPVGPSTYQAPMQCVGPMTRDVRDAALVLSVIAGPDAGNFLSSKVPAPDYLSGLDDGVGGVRVAWSPDFGRLEPLRPDVIEVAHDAAKTFAGLGALLDEPNLRLQDVHDPLELDARLSVAEAYYPTYEEPAYYHYQQFLADLRKDPEKWAKVSVYVRDRYDGRGERPTQLEYAMSIPPRIRNRPVDHLEDVFARYDVLACPVIARPAFVAGDPGVNTWNYTEYTLIVNVAGYAAASVPAGFVDDLPVGLQLIAPPTGNRCFCGPPGRSSRAAPGPSTVRPSAERVWWNAVPDEFSWLPGGPVRGNANSGEKISSSNMAAGKCAGPSGEEGGTWAPRWWRRRTGSCQGRPIQESTSFWGLPTERALQVRPGTDPPAGRTAGKESGRRRRSDRPHHRTRLPLSPRSSPTRLRKPTASLPAGGRPWVRTAWC